MLRLRIETAFARVERYTVEILLVALSCLWLIVLVLRSGSPVGADTAVATAVAEGVRTGLGVDAFGPFAADARAPGGPLLCALVSLLGIGGATKAIGLAAAVASLLGLIVLLQRRGWSRWAYIAVPVIATHPIFIQAVVWDPREILMTALMPWMVVLALPDVAHQRARLVLLGAAAGVALLIRSDGFALAVATCIWVTLSAPMRWERLGWTVLGLSSTSLPALVTLRALGIDYPSFATLIDHFEQPAPVFSIGVVATSLVGNLMALPNRAIELIPWPIVAVGVTSIAVAAVRREPAARAAALFVAPILLLAHSHFHLPTHTFMIPVLIFAAAAGLVQFAALIPDRRARVACICGGIASFYSIPGHVRTISDQERARSAATIHASLLCTAVKAAAAARGGVILVGAEKSFYSHHSFDYCIDPGRQTDHLILTPARPEDVGLDFLISSSVPRRQPDVELAIGTFGPWTVYQNRTSTVAQMPIRSEGALIDEEWRLDFPRSASCDTREYRLHTGRHTFQVEIESAAPNVVNLDLSSSEEALGFRHAGAWKSLTGDLTIGPGGALFISLCATGSKTERSVAVRKVAYGW